ncbi:hypothetical protein IFR05_016593, partial [Cadophora sp. M221]
YPASPQIWATSLAPLGALKNFLLTNINESSSHILGPWISPAAKEHHYAAFGINYDAPLLWYRRAFENTGWQEERQMVERGEIVDDSKGRRALMIGGLKDAVWAIMKSCAEEGRLSCVDVDAGHWIMLEKPEETNKILRRFVEGEEVGDGKVGAKGGREVDSRL